MATGQISQWLVNEMLKSYFTPDKFRPAYNRFNLCLLRAAVPLGARISQANEPYGVGGYVRHTMSFNSGYWQLSGFREVTNKSDLVFPTATGGWGLITNWALITAEFGVIEDGSTSIVAATGPLATPVSVTTGVQVVVAAGTLGLGIYDGS